MIDELLTAYREERRLSKRVNRVETGAHLRQAQKSRYAPKSEDLEEAIANVPQRPHELEYLFGYFVKIARRVSDPGGPISFVDLSAFMLTMGIDLHPWESVVIGALDDLRLLTDAQLEKLADVDDGRSGRT